MLRNVRATIARFDLVRPGSTVLVGYSGGPDSTALLHALVALAPELGMNLVAAHLDHAARPGSDEDRVYCQRMAKRLGVAVLTEALEPKRRSEAELRRQRYRFFATQAAMIGADAVATGHTASDRVETFLLHLVRGSGSQGLGSLHPSTVHDGVRIIRPLWDVTRADVVAFLAKGHHGFVEDPTNKDPRHDRNRVRHEVVPLLESLRAGASEGIARSGEMLASEADFLRTLAERAIARASDPRRLHPALARHVVREIIRRERGDLAGISLRMVDEALEALRQSGRDGRTRHLPLAGPWVVEASKAGLRVLAGKRGRPLAKPTQDRQKVVILCKRRGASRPRGGHSP